MKCFEWNFLASDYLSQSLPESLKKSADRHLKNCPECHGRLDHYLELKSTLSHLKKATLPPALKRAPLSVVLPRAQKARLTLTSWAKLPWILRIILEAGGIIASVLIIIASAPAVRDFYENRVLISFSQLKENLKSQKLDEGALDPTLPPLQVASSDHLPAGTEKDELSGEDDSEDLDSPLVKVGRSELWRFTLKTVSPDELRSQVVKTLLDLNVSATTPGLGGVQVPGGIEFDLILSQAIVPELKQSLEKLVKNYEESSGETHQDDSFSWYKVKSKRKIAEGKSQIVIWLAQPN